MFIGKKWEINGKSFKILFKAARLLLLRLSENEASEQIFVEHEKQRLFSKIKKAPKDLIAFSWANYNKFTTSQVFLMRFSHKIICYSYLNCIARTSVLNFRFVHTMIVQMFCDLHIFKFHMFSYLMKLYFFDFKLVSTFLRCVLKRKISFLCFFIFPIDPSYFILFTLINWLQAQFIALCLQYFFII